MNRMISSRIQAFLGACLTALPLPATAQDRPDPGPACLEILTYSVDFHQVWVGKEGRGYAQVRNACPREIAITKIKTSPSVFRSYTPLPLALPAWNSAWVEFRLIPETTGTVTGSARLYPNTDTRPLSLSLSGVGIAPPAMSVSPTTLQLTQAAGTKGSVDLRISNTGGDRLEAIVDFTGQAPRPAAGWKVAFLHTPTPAGYGQFIDRVRSLSNVDALDVFDGSAGVPTLAYLNGFDMVMVESGSGGNWSNAGATGDSLSAYVQSGGRMVYFAQTFIGQSGLGGQIGDYTTIKGYQTAFAGPSGILADHPINAGVGPFWAASAMTYDRVHDGSSVSLGNYAESGYVTGAVSVLHPIVLLNFHPADGSWSGDVPRLVANALDYLGTQATWMATNGAYPFPGFDIFTVEAGATRTLNMNVSAYRLAPGNYQGELKLLHSDPNQATPYIVPVTLTVTP